MTSNLMLMTVLFCCAAPETWPAGHAPPTSRGLDNAFFAMDTATRDEHHQTIESQLRMVKELGFAGWAMSADAGVDEALKVADGLRLKLFAVYTGVDIDGKSPAWTPKLPEIIRKLKGHGTAVWLFVTSKQNQKASDAADAVAVAGIQQVAAMAAESGLSVSLYPHNGFYAATARDAIRLARKADRKNVTLTFNLCHWLRTDRGKDLDAILRESLPYLSIVSINGADTDGADWDRLIQPLGRGTFDVYGLLVKLRRLGFEGPVGLQGYGIKGDVHEHLSRGMETWRDYRRRLANEAPDAR